MREILHNLQNRMQKAKQNVDGISQAMKVRKLQGTPAGLRWRPREVLGKMGHTEMLMASARGSGNLLFEVPNHAHGLHNGVRVVPRQERPWSLCRVQFCSVLMSSASVYAGPAPGTRGRKMP